MNRRAPILHLLAVPVIAIIMCNGFTISLINLLSGSWHFNQLPLRHFIVLLTGLYGLYLHFFRKRENRNYPIIIGSIIIGILWAYFRISFPIWIFGALLNFTIMRSLMLSKSWRVSITDFMYVLVGTGLALFIYPISLFLAVALFITIQIICEMRHVPLKLKIKRDRFYESLQQAERVLSRS